MAAALTAELGEIDLTDPEVRFAAMLQLRIVAPPLPVSGTPGPRERSAG